MAVTATPMAMRILNNLLNVSDIRSPPSVFIKVKQTLGQKQYACHFLQK